MHRSETSGQPWRIAADKPRYRGNEMLAVVEDEQRVAPVERGRHSVGAAVRIAGRGSRDDSAWRPNAPSDSEEKSTKRMSSPALRAQASDLEGHARFSDATRAGNGHEPVLFEQRGDAGDVVLSANQRRYLQARVGARTCGDRRAPRTGGCHFQFGARDRRQLQRRGEPRNGGAVGLLAPPPLECTDRIDAQPSPFGELFLGQLRRETVLLKQLTETISAVSPSRALAPRPVSGPLCFCVGPAQSSKRTRSWLISFTKLA